MRGKHVISALLFAAVSTAYAQQATLGGQVFIHNSEYRTGKVEYVEGAYVSAPNTTTQATNRKGEFELAFAAVDAGNIITASVEKAGLEVVNPSALQGIAIGREAPLRIVLAKQGEVAQARKELLQSSTRALIARHGTLAAALRRGGEEGRAALLELEKHFNREIATRFEAEQLLNEQMQELEGRLPERADKLARANLDFASARYRQAYELYRQGNGEGAAASLSEAVLDKEGEAALASLKESERKGKNKQAAEEREKLQRIVESYQLKAQAHLLLFQYRDALNAQLKATFLLEKAGGEESAALAEAYGDVALYYLLREEYGDALHYQQKNIKLKERLLGPETVEIAAACNRMAEIRRGLEDYPGALDAQRRAVDINERALGPNHPALAVAYSGLARAYQGMGAYEHARDAQLKALHIQERALAPTDPAIGRTSHTLAVIHLDGGAYLEALEAQLKALFIQEQALEHNHPDIFRSYNTLARIYLNLMDYEKALAVQLKILGLQEQALPTGHPDIANSYHNIASTYYFLQNLDSALEHEHQAYAMLKEQLPPYHPLVREVEASFAFLYTTRGERRYAAGRHTEAIQDLKNALEFQPNNPEARKRIKQMETAQANNPEPLALKGGATNKPAPERNSRVETPREEKPQSYGLFQATKATSLRSGPSSSAKVLRRLAPGDRLEVVEKTEYYWWKVRDGGRTGYVKALLLEEVD